MTPARLISTGSSAASSRTRAGKSLRLGVPTFSPTSRNNARIPFSTSRRLLSTIRLAVSSARQERQGGLFTCTARYQPVRMICAIPRASLRSVLFGIAPIAALAWRVSMQIAGMPASVSPACSQAVSEQASSPTRSIVIPHAPKKATSASGSLAARASRTIFPASSTTQIVVSSNDTSNPAK